ncbi:MAG: ZIP family metal transporter [bacterium]
MNNAIIFGVLGGFSLVIGAFFGIRFNFKQKVIAGFMAFGSGVLICALTTGLMEEAFRYGGFDAAIIGFLAGGLVFVGGDYLLHLAGARKHRHKPLVSSDKDSNGKLITLGAILDGVPESIALGIVLFVGQSGGVLMLAAIFLSNFPEGISSVSGLLKEGFSKKKIYLIWTIVAMISAILTIASYIFLHDLNPNIIGILESFAAGAILAMLADSMMPEAYEEGGFGIGLLTIVGFIIAFVLSRIS